jgi:hypothetical protein
MLSGTRRGRDIPHLVTCVASCARPANTDLIARREGVLNLDVQVGERGAQSVEKWVKAVRARPIRAAVVQHGIGRKHLSYRLSPSLIPDQLEPTPPQTLF